MKRTRTLRTYSLFQKIVAYLLSAAIPLATLPGEALALPHGGVVSKGSAPWATAPGSSASGRAPLPPPSTGAPTM